MARRDADGCGEASQPREVQERDQAIECSAFGTKANEPLTWESTGNRYPLPGLYMTRIPCVGYPYVVCALARTATTLRSECGRACAHGARSTKGREMAPK